MNIKERIYREPDFNLYKVLLNNKSLNLDIYYQPEFLSIDAKMQGGKCVIYTIEFESDIFIYPYVELPLAEYGFDGYVDIISPYGYCGPYCTDYSILSEAEARFLTYIGKQKVVTEFIRYHHFYNEVESNMFHENVNNVFNRNTLLLNLDQDWEEIWNNEMSKTNRNLVRKLEKEGYKFEISYNTEHLDEFIKMYHLTMQNAGATDFYYFEKENYYELFEKLDDKIFLARVLKEGVTYSSALFFISGGNLTYYLSARNVDQFRVPASNMMLTFVAKYGQKSGLKWFNLGSGRTGELSDPLFKFKSNFTRNYKPFFIGKRIHNQKIYASLVENYVAEKGEEEYQNVKHILQFYR